MKKQKDQQNTAKTIGSNKPKSILLKKLKYFLIADNKIKQVYLLTQERIPHKLEKLRLSSSGCILPCNFNYNIKLGLFQIYEISMTGLRCLTLKKAYAYGMR